MARKLLMSALLIIGIAIGSPALAQSRAGTAELGIFGGWTFYDFDQNQDLGEVDDDVVYGVRAGWNITDMFGLEAFYDRSEPDIDAIGEDDTYDVTSYGIDALIQWGGRNTMHVPYFLVGYVKGAEDIDEAEFVEAGVGYKYFFSPAFGLRGDIRALGSDEDRTGIGTDNWDVKATLGLSFVLGGS